MSIGTAQPYHLAAGGGAPMSWFTARFQLKASDPQIGLMELEGSPGVEPPMHVHRNEDEWYYLLDGEVTFHVGGQNYEGRAGSLVFLPRAVPHTFSIRTPTARMLLLNAPGGFERMFDLAPVTPRRPSRPSPGTTFRSSGRTRAKQQAALHKTDPALIRTALESPVATPQQALDVAYERWNAGNLDRYLELYDDEIRMYGYSPEPMNKAEVRGFYEMIFRAFDSPKLTFHKTLWDGDSCAIRFTMTGRHVAEFMGVPATDTEIVLPGITVLHVRGDRVIERFSQADMLGLLVQIGAVPAVA